MIYRRQRQQAIFAIFLAVIAVVNVLFYFILMRPSQKEYANLQDSIQELQKTIKSSEQFYEKRKTQATKIGNFEGDKKILLMEHLIPRKQGYSEVIETLNSVVLHSGVKKTRVSYSLNPSGKTGLNPLSITIPVEGNYSNVVKFIQELEDSKTFYLITAISVERSNQGGGQQGQPGAFSNAAAAGGTGAVALQLSLETYFYQ
jgi:Tfp pilus assembly protein PilO